MIPVLDKGYIKLVKYWGTEEEIVEAARMSTGKGFLGWDKDEKFLKFLYTNKHMSPFEQVGMTIEVKAPIFVIREWMRHRTMSYNEMSGRYIAIPNDNYMPSFDRVKNYTTITSNKQASGSGAKGSEDEVGEWHDRLAVLYEDIQAHYEEGLNLGVPRELARICLPVGRYSVMRVNSNLRNWIQFLELRLSKDAQEEIREYAHKVHLLLITHFPRTMELFRQELYRADNN